jgi:hypothetical protein
MQVAKRNAFEGPGEDSGGQVVPWLLAALVAGAALTGGVILLSLVTFALQPSPAVQTVVGVGVALGTAVFAWLVASALRRG